MRTWFLDSELTTCFLYNTIGKMDGYGLVTQHVRNARQSKVSSTSHKERWFNNSLLVTKMECFSYKGEWENVYGWGTKIHCHHLTAADLWSTGGWMPTSMNRLVENKWSQSNLLQVQIMCIFSCDRKLWKTTQPLDNSNQLTFLFTQLCRLIYGLLSSAVLH